MIPRTIRSSLALTLALASLLLAANVACATPVMSLFSYANTTASPGGTLDYFVTVANIGSTPTEGPLELQTSLPSGMSISSVSSFPEETPWNCPELEVGASTLRCINEGVQDPHETSDLERNRTTLLRISAHVDSDASGVLTSSFALSGGSAKPTATVDPTRITSTLPGFGIDGFEALVTANAGGDPDTQAGGHPYAVSTAIFFNTSTSPNSLLGEIYPAEPPKDISVELPPGLIGDPAATGPAKCTAVQLANSYGIEAAPLCPPGSQVGVTTVFSSAGAVLGNPLPVFNMVAPAGVPARFGFNIAGTVVTLDGSVRSDGDYGLSVNAKNVPEGLALAGTIVTFWGVPADPSHEIERSCPGKKAPSEAGPSCATESPERPFLRNPTACTAPGEGLSTTLSVDSWAHPGVFTTATSTSHALPGFPSDSSEWGPVVGITGCDVVPFSPSLGVSADEPAAGAPSGYRFDVSLPQSQDPSAIGEADIKRIVVTLPEGVRVSPSSANGLGACSESQIGFVGGGFGEPNPLRFNEEEPSCSGSSKLGEVEITTPLLEAPLKGAAYLASPNQNPFGSLLAMYLVVKGPGVIVKLPGLIQADPVTGRLTATFDHDPQLPVSDVRLALKGGSGAALMNPSACGAYATSGSFSSWARPESPVGTSSSEQIDTNANGEACSPAGFAPVFSGGTTSAKAGAFSPFVLSFARGDAEQEVKGLSVTLPPGLAAILKGVPLCSNADASAGACPAASQIGSVTVGAGPGVHPFFLKGQVYLTGSYNGGPYGEVVVVPAIAGPFNLGDVVVRGSIRIDPHTSQATVLSDPFPQFVNGSGIPTDVRRVDVVLDRPGFTFNPTNCDTLTLAGTLVSTQGAAASVASRFQASQCRQLSFRPSFKVSTNSHSTRRNGIGLDVKVGSGTGQANIHAVKVSLPKRLPSRDSTLKLACLDSVFETNPAACPSGSNVGNATAVTPILGKALTGPAYLVSHGGAAFPDLEVVLQSEGITLILDGHTNIKGGVTTSTFNTVPDAPINSFELKLPTGPHSVLAAVPANGSLCGSVLSMPTTLTGQNGAVVKQATKIAVTGCPKHKTVKSKKAHKEKGQERLRGVGCDGCAKHQG